MNLGFMGTDYTKNALTQDLLSSTLQARSKLKTELTANESTVAQLASIQTNEKSRIIKLIDLRFETVMKALTNNKTDILSRDRQLSAIESELQATLERNRILEDSQIVGLSTMIKSLQEIIPVIIDLKSFAFKLDIEEKKPFLVKKTQSSDMMTQTNMIKTDIAKDFAEKIKELHKTIEVQNSKILQLEENLHIKNKFKDTLSKSLCNLEESVLAPESKRLFCQLKQAVHCEEENFMKHSIEAFFNEYFNRSSQSSSIFKEVETLRKLVTIHEAKHLEISSRVKELIDLCKSMVSPECDQPVAMYMKKIELKNKIKEIETLDFNVRLPVTIFGTGKGETQHKTAIKETKNKRCLRCGKEDPTTLCSFEETRFLTAEDGSKGETVKCKRFELSHLFA